MAAVLSACAAPKFPTIDSVRVQLRDHESEYVEAAEYWNSQKDVTTFAYFGEDSYRWGDYFIDRVPNGYLVGTGSNNRIQIASFADAAHRAQADVGQLTWWIGKAKALHIYSVTRWSQGDYVEIALAGSEWQPYGLRYAPRNNEKTLEFLHAATQGGITNRNAVVWLQGRWFFFREEGF